MKKVYRKPHRYKKRKSIFKNRFFLFGILIFIFLFSLFYFLFISETFRVKEVIVSGQEKISEEQIKNLIPFKNIFLLNLTEVKQNLSEKFPQIAEIKIKRKFPDTLNVVVVERKATAVFCEEEEKCFLADKESIIFELASETKLSLVRIAKPSLTDFKLGEKVINKEQLSQILEIDNELKPEITIKEFIIASEDKLVAKTLDHWEIYFNLQGDIKWQLAKLRAVLEEKIPPEKRKNLEYIELRFGNLAPYKYR